MTPDGISIVNKKTKALHLLAIEDSGDDGDTYDYSPPEKDIIENITFANAKHSTTIGDLVQTLYISGEFNLFKDLNARSNNLNDSQIALTLFRSVGYLGKPELSRRPGIASGKEFKYVPPLLRAN
ncbi:MAG: hypothetical protein ACRC9L_07480 [Brevinema sp.]